MLSAMRVCTMLPREQARPASQPQLTQAALATSAARASGQGSKRGRVRIAAAWDTLGQLPLPGKPRLRESNRNATAVRAAALHKAQPAPAHRPFRGLLHVPRALVHWSCVPPEGPEPTRANSPTRQPGPILGIPRQPEEPRPLVRQPAAGPRPGNWSPDRQKFLLTCLGRAVHVNLTRVGVRSPEDGAQEGPRRLQRRRHRLPHLAHSLSRRSRHCSVAADSPDQSEQLPGPGRISRPAETGLVHLTQADGGLRAARSHVTVTRDRGSIRTRTRPGQEPPAPQRGLTNLEAARPLARGFVTRH